MQRCLPCGCGTGIELSFILYSPVHNLRPHMRYFHTHLSYPIHLWPFLGMMCVACVGLELKEHSVEARGLGSMAVVYQPSNW